MALVLVWHLQPITSGAIEPTTLGIVFRMLVQGFYWEIGLLGVPIFFMVSLHLYYARRERGEPEYFRSRLVRLVVCFIFWAAVQWVVAIAVNKGSPGFSWWDIPEGGPELPLVYGSVFYFLFELILLVLVAELVLRLPTRVRHILLVILGVAPLIVFTALQSVDIVLRHSLIMSFLPYVSAAYVWTRWPERFSHMRWWFTGLWFIAMSSEQIIHQLVRGAPLYGSPYDRVAIVFGALAVCAWVSSLASRLDWTATRYLSYYSLGIFAVHKYFLLLMLTVLPEMRVTFAGLWIDLRYLAAFPPTLALTAAAVWFLARSPLRRFVR